LPSLHVIRFYIAVALTPLQEYHSIAHCAAGGCSSIATSFVFTPSECIKQQMQVGSQYQNCWYAIFLASYWAVHLFIPYVRSFFLEPSK